MKLRRGSYSGQGFPDTLFVGGHPEFIGDEYDSLGVVDTSFVKHVRSRGHAITEGRDALKAAAAGQFPDMAPATAIMRSSIKVDIVQQTLFDRLTGQATVLVTASGDVLEYYGSNAIGFGRDPLGNLGIHLAQAGHPDAAVELVKDFRTEGFNDDHLKSW